MFRGKMRKAADIGGGKGVVGQLIVDVVCFRNCQQELIRKDFAPRESGNQFGVAAEIKIKLMLFEHVCQNGGTMLQNTDIDIGVFCMKAGQDIRKNMSVYIMSAAQN